MFSGLALAIISAIAVLRLSVYMLLFFCFFFRSYLHDRTLLGAISSLI